MDAHLMLLAYAGVAAAGATAAVVRAGRLGAASRLWFGAGRFVGELAVFHLLVSAALLAMFVTYTPALEHDAGRLAAWLIVASWPALAVAHQRSRRARACLDSALRDGLGAGYRAEIPATRSRPRLDRLEFVAVAGGSAGAHIAALIALTYDDAELQPGFEQVDTRPTACVCLHGVYDLADREDYRQDGRRRVDWLGASVMPCALGRDPTAWERASPIAQVRADAPPFFILHGEHDSIVPVAEARAFARRLRHKSTQPVAYAELPGAQHAWDTLHSVRALHTVGAITHFLEWCVARQVVMDAACGGSSNPARP